MSSRQVPCTSHLPMAPRGPGGSLRLRSLRGLPPVEGNRAWGRDRNFLHECIRQNDLSEPELRMAHHRHLVLLQPTCYTCAKSYTLVRMLAGHRCQPGEFIAKNWIGAFMIMQVVTLCWVSKAEESTGRCQFSGPDKSNYRLVKTRRRITYGVAGIPL